LPFAAAVGKLKTARHCWWHDFKENGSHHGGRIEQTAMAEKRIHGWRSRLRLRSLFALLTAFTIALSLLVAWVGFVYAARAKQVTVLNGLRDAINANYGYKDGTPRVNCGPCIRFAIAFRDRWNTRFPAKAKFGCLCKSGLCGHVAIKLPDGSFFDGGNGVMSERKLKTMFSDCTLEGMDELDMRLFEKRDMELLHQYIGGQSLEHYLDCPNYSDDLTAKLIEKYLAQLAND
jgi:hypothetical protein